MIKDEKIEAFESTLQASHAWINEYGAKLGQAHPPLAFRCLRAALHVIRDRLPVAEAAALAAQLPMLLRGAYYEGWRPMHKAPRIHDANEVYQAVSNELGDGLGARPHDVMRALFVVLEDHVAPGEIKKLRGILPQPLREMWSSAVPSAAGDTHASR